MKNLSKIFLLFIILITFCACSNKSSIEYYQGTDLEELETFTSVTGIELNIEKDAPESNGKIYNYLADNDADGLGAILKYEAYLEEYGFSKAEDLSNDEITTYLMNDYIIVTGKFSPQSNVIQYAITIPNGMALAEIEAGNKATEQENNETPVTPPQKGDEEIYSEFCQLVDDGNYTEAVRFLEHENLSMEYANTKDYYYYAKAMEVYRETEFLTYSVILNVVDTLKENVSEDFLDSAEIIEKITNELAILVGTHIYNRDSKYIYDCYYLIIMDNGDVILDMGKRSEGKPQLSYADYQLVYVNLEEDSFYMLCDDWADDIEHCKYAITILPDYLALTKAWGNSDEGIFAANYKKVS